MAELAVGIAEQLVGVTLIAGEKVTATEVVELILHVPARTGDSTLPPIGPHVGAAAALPVPTCCM